jgi:hypothetical protein
MECLPDERFPRRAAALTISSILMIVVMVTAVPAGTMASTIASAAPFANPLWTFAFFYLIGR